MQTFTLGPKIYLGECSVGPVLSECRRVLIVTDKFLHESGKVKYITNYLYESKVEFDIYSDIHPDPDIESVMTGLERMKTLDADGIIAMGGGSAIDAAKAIKYFYETKVANKHVNFVIIPTTSGTGSEVSNYSIITDNKTHTKHPLVDASLYADAAILDAGLVVSAPKKITADTGIDALTHALEALVSKNHTDFSDAFAEKAAKLICENLLEAYEHPTNVQARQAVHNAATMAGAAFSNAGLGLLHAMSHAFGARFHVPHGRANGILLTYVMNFNAGCSASLTPVAERYAYIARVLNLDKSGTRQGALSLIRAVHTLCNKVGIPASIKAAGIDREEFMGMVDDMAEAALNDATITTNPRECTKEDIKNIYISAYNGRY